MNFERQYLAALDALIVALGGVVPVAVVLNFQVAVLLRLVALVQAVGGVLPSPSINHQAAVLAHWRAAIAARGGVVPTVYQNYREGLLLHVQAFQATRGASAAIAGRNFEESILALLSAAPSGGGPVYDADAAAWFSAVEASGSVFVNGAKTAYNTFFVQLKADENLAPFSNGMLLSFAGFTGLAGCFVPIASRNKTLPTNMGFVAGQKSTNALQGNGTAYIVCNIGFLASQQNNNSFTVYLPETPPAITGGFHPYLGVLNLANGLWFSQNMNVALNVRNSADTSDTLSGNKHGLLLSNRSAAANFYGESGLPTLASQTFNRACASPATDSVGIFRRAGESQASISSSAKLSMAGWGNALANPVAFRNTYNSLISTLSTL